MVYLTDSQNIDQGMLRSAQPSQNIDIPGLAALCLGLIGNSCQELSNIFFSRKKKIIEAGECIWI